MTKFLFLLILNSGKFYYSKSERVKETLCDLFNSSSGNFLVRKFSVNLQFRKIYESLRRNTP